MGSSQERVAVTQDPPNAETPLSALTGAITPAPLFYVRCNFPVPDVDASSWRLAVGGRVRQALTVSLAELQQLPQQEMIATLECAGNGRRLMRPQPPGTSWGMGAVSTGRFTGVPLRLLLERAGLEDDVVELVFEAADAGIVEDGTVTRFARSLPVQQARHADTLLVWALNGEPLAGEHGFPVRLVVPGWYGMASVKWLTRIVAVSTPFIGHFQTDRYVYVGHPEYDRETPVTAMQVRALITAPDDDAIVAGPDVAVRGIAWSGFGIVRRVAVSTDGGQTWGDAELVAGASQYAAVEWHYTWRVARAGEHELVARAEDSSGRVQPLDPVWNELGYANNVVHRVRIRVAPR